MLNINDVPLEDRWRITAFEVMKYDPRFRNIEGHYLKKEWIMFSEIGKSFDGVKLTYKEYKAVEDRYMSAFQYLFDFFKCYRIQFVQTTFLLDDNELKNIKDKDLEKFYLLLKKKRTLNIQAAQMAARLILRSAIAGRFYCKGNQDIGVRFEYDFYMLFNVPEINKIEIKNHIEKNIGLYTHR